jgi:hypothetical protein
MRSQRLLPEPFQWETALDEIETQARGYLRRKRLTLILGPLAGIIFFFLFWWGGPWTLRVFFLSFSFGLMMLFLWGLLMPVALRNKLVDAVEQEPTTDDIPFALRLLALLPLLGIHQGAEQLQRQTIARLALQSPTQLATLQEPERALLRRWVERGGAEEKIRALLVLTTLGDDATRSLAQHLQHHPDERVREAALDFLRQGSRFL